MILVYILLLIFSSVSIIKDMIEANKYYGIKELIAKERSVELISQIIHIFSLFMIGSTLSRYIKPYNIIIGIVCYLVLHCSIVNIYYYIHHKDNKSVPALITLSLFIIALFMVFAFILYLILGSL